jgi:tetratricopeptide (TPR) repeat protein
VSSVAQRAALAELDRARPATNRLDIGRDPDDNAADLLEAWGAVETALRALVGGTGLGGQSLIRELRTREVISFDTGHALVEFLAARDRANSPSYRPTPGDLAAAREAVQKLEGGLLAASVGAPVSPNAPVVAPVAEPAPGDAAATPARRRSLNTRIRGVPAWAGLLGILLLLGAIAVPLVMALSRGGGPAAFRRGQEAYAAGRREAARAEFEKAVRDDPKHAPSHVYLGRVAREMGDMPTANRELRQAIEIDPRNAVAQREMGSFLLANNSPALARNFYVRALQIDPSDRSAMGFLACALTRINRPDLAQPWYQRAGQGAWSSCAMQRPMMPGQVPGQPYPPGYPPPGYPAPQQVPPGYPQPQQPLPPATYPPQVRPPA